MGLLPNKTQEEFSELKCNSVAKEDFEAITLNDFWAKYVPLYRNIVNVAVHILLSFSAMSIRVVLIFSIFTGLTLRECIFW